MSQNAEPGEPERDGGGDTPPSALTRTLWIVAIALYVALAGAAGVLASAVPLVGDDFLAIQIARQHPALNSWTWYWYSSLFGRLPAIAGEWLVFHSSLFFSIAVAATLPVLALLVVWLGTGTRPRTPRELGLVGFVTVALWFSLPTQWDVFWRSGWPSYSLSAALALGFLIPYRSWRAGSPGARTGSHRVLDAVALFALGALAGCSHESVMLVLAVLVISFAWRAQRSSQLASVPAHLWAGAAGLLVGAAALIAAPGNRVRAAESPLGALARLSSISMLVGRIFFVWLTPALPWLACMLIAGVALGANSRDASSGLSTRGVVWLSVAVGALALLPVIAFPQVAALAGERTIFFTTIALFVGASALLASARQTTAFAALPELALSAGLIVLLVIAIGDVGVNIRYARAIDGYVARRAQLIESYRASGDTSVTVPPLGIAEVGMTDQIRAFVWGDISNDPNLWINRSIAQYYGVRSIATPVIPNMLGSATYRPTLMRHTRRTRTGWAAPGSSTVR